MACDVSKTLLRKAVTPAKSAFLVESKVSDNDTYPTLF